MTARNLSMAAAGTAPAAPTTIEYVGGYTTTINGTTSNTDVTLTSLTGGVASAPSAGDLVVVYFAVAGSATGANLAISGYTEVSQRTVADSSDVDLLVAYKLLTAADTSFTITGGTGDANDSGAVAVQVFRNAMPPTQSATADTGNTAVANPPTITPTKTGSWIIAGGGAGHQAGARTFSSSDLTNFISAGSNQTYDATVGMGYKVWTSGAFDPAAFTFSGTDSTNYASTATTFVLVPNDGIGQQEFTSTGTSTFIVPAGVTSISVVCIGGGEGGSAAEGGRGGRLKYVNNISVTPLESLTVDVGAGGAGTSSTSGPGNSGGNSSLKRSTTVLCLARGGGTTATEVGTGYSGGSGGAGRTVSGSYGNAINGGGGGGAAGYSGNGGNGGGNSSPTAGTGGGGGGGGCSTSSATNDNVNGISYGTRGAAGGGVGTKGGGSNGAAGTNANTPTGGGGGSGGNSGTRDTAGTYGGGGRGGVVDSNNNNYENGGAGANGAVRIIWPGTDRQYPSTRTADE